MSKTTQNYLDLITSEYQKSVNFLSMIALDTGISVRVQGLFDDMIRLFSLSTPPVGNQLDIIGQWVGISRNVTIPITGVFFAWNDTVQDGWNSGSWQPPGNPTQITTLPDDIYLNLIIFKIAENHWDGTLATFYSILVAAFPQYKFYLLDYQNMSYSLGIMGNPLVDAVTLSLLTSGEIPMRPEGVKIVNYFTNVDSNPFFAWDVESTDLKGWNEGSWALVLEPT